MRPPASRIGSDGLDWVLLLRFSLSLSLSLSRSNRYVATASVQRRRFVLRVSACLCRRNGPRPRQDGPNRGLKKDKQQLGRAFSLVDPDTASRRRRDDESGEAPRASLVNPERPAQRKRRRKRNQQRKKEVRDANVEEK